MQVIAEGIGAAQRNYPGQRYLEAPLCVWAGDDGPGIRAAADASGLAYLAISRDSHPSGRTTVSSDHDAELEHIFAS